VLAEERPGYTLGSMAPDDPRASKGVRHWVRVLAIVLGTLLAYSPSLPGSFIWDDNDYVTENPYVTDDPLLARDEALTKIWTPGETHQYYPLVYTTFWLEVKAWGLEPLGFRLVNILIHIASALLLWRICARLAIPGGWAVGMVFALHPLQVESVAWITERKNVLSGFFYLASALAYLRFHAGRKWGSWAFAFALFGAALLSKSVTCSLPAALILAMLWRRDRVGARELLPLVPFFAVGLLAAWNTAHIEHANVGARGALFEASFLERLLNSGRILLFYPWKLLWPEPLLFNYPRWDGGVTLVNAACLALVVALFAWAAARFRAGRRGLFLALAFYAGTLFPALGFVNVYPMRFSWVADHFAYLATIGIFLAVIPFVRVRLGKDRKRLAGGLLWLVATGFTYHQASVWKDSGTLYRYTVEHNEDAWLCHSLIATELLRSSGIAEAQGDPGAREELEQALVHLERAEATEPNDFLVQHNLSSALRRLGRTELALEHSRRAVELLPSWAEASANHALNLREVGREAESAQWARNALEQHAANYAAHWILAEHYFEARNYSPALQHHEAAFLYAPSGLQRRVAGARLAYFLAAADDARLRDPQRALALGQELAAEGGGNVPTLIRARAAALAQLGQVEEAAATARQLLEAVGGMRGSLSEEIEREVVRLEEELAAYERGEAFVR